MVIIIENMSKSITTELITESANKMKSNNMHSTEISAKNKRLIILIGSIIIRMMIMILS